MDELHETDEVIRHLVQWADGQDAIRAVLLTSTRAVPNATVDAYSDYDVILVMRDIWPFLSDRRWPKEFGEVLVAYWDSRETDPDTGIEVSGNIIQYTGLLKIDFSLWPVEHLERIVRLPVLPVELDAGYRVVLDKDGLAARLRPPTHSGYIPSPPDEAEYLTLVNDFFIGVPYVTVALLRDEVLAAKWCLDYDMRYVYLLPMLEWRMECDHGWTVSPGINGKGLKKRLPPDIWAELESTYAGMDVEENREAMFRMVALFRRVAREVGDALGYAYPEELDRGVTEHARRLWEGAEEGWISR